MVTLKISPCTNVTLTFDIDFGLDHPVHGGYRWGSPTPISRSNCQTNKLKSGFGPLWGPGIKTNWPTDRRSQCNLKFNLRHCTANYRPVLSSERTPYMKNKESKCHSNKCNIWSLAPRSYVPEDGNFQNNRCDNLKSYKIRVSLFTISHLTTGAETTFETSCLWEIIYPSQWTASIIISTEWFSHCRKTYRIMTP
jgi:hypothetical protein